MIIQPKVTIITVTFNAGKKLKETVDSILKQTYHNIEILVKDGMSTDGSTEFLKKEPYDSRVEFYEEKDNGIYEAMNRAIELATGEYYVFINSGDSLYASTTIEDAVHHMIIDNFSHDVYYGDNFTCNRNAITHSPRKLTHYVCFGSVIGHQSIVYSAKVFDIVKYDLRFRISACITHYIVAYKRYHITFKYIPVIIAYYEGGGVSDGAVGRKRSIQERRICLKEEYGKAYYWYTFLMMITLKRLKQDLSMLQWFEPVYHFLTMFIKGNKNG